MPQRGVHRLVPKSASHHETETPGEGAVHQHAGSGQGGDEGVHNLKIQCKLCFCMKFIFGLC